MSDPGPANSPVLKVRGGPSDGARLPVDEPDSLIGSDSDCHLVVVGAAVSAVHARIVAEEQGLVLSDANSLSGTYLNGRRLEGPQVLHDGDCVSLGPPDSPDSVALEVSLVPDTAEAGVVDLGDEPDVFDLGGEDVGAPGAVPPTEPPSVTAPPSGIPAPHGESPTPAPAPTPPARPAPVAATSPPGSPPRPPAGPDYVTGPPSIMPERPRSGDVVPAPPAAPRRVCLPKPAPARQVSRAVVVAAAIVAAAGGGFALFRVLSRPSVVVLGVTPPMVQPGQDVSISGTGFDTDPRANTVRFGETVAPVGSAAPDRVIAQVPKAVAGEQTLDVPVSVEAHGVRSNALFLKVFVPPRVDSVDPPYALPGEEVLARGSHLEGDSVEVTVDAVPAEVVGVEPGAIRFRVPELSLDRPLRELRVRVGRDWAKAASLVLGRPPIVASVVPPRAMAGDCVSLHGYGFAPDPEGNVVRFGQRRALVLFASANELRTAVPAGGVAQGQRQVPISVEAGGAVSSTGASFTLLRPSAELYQPRFFPEPVPGHSPGDHVFVSTELGPFLLLSGRAESPSLAGRAALVAERLNRLVRSAASSPTTLVVQDGPAPTIMVRERQTVVLAATPEDASGYAKSWLAGTPGRPTQRRLAEYWMALIQDYLSLFIQRRRPHLVLEMSPDGQVLTNLYRDAAVRSGAASGVPLRLVAELDRSAADALYRLAVSVPGARAGSGTAVLVGHWKGTVQETGQGARPVQLRFYLQGSQLAGTFTARVGEIAGDLPLRDLSFDGRKLSFVLDAGGFPRHFRGSFEGGAIGGTIHAQPEAGAPPVGRFTLQYAR